MRIEGVRIVMLGVESVDRALPFYRDVLGLPLRAQIPGFAFLDGGGITLALSEPLAAASDVRVGATEVVFNVDDVTAVYTALLARGVHFVRELRIVDGVHYSAAFVDPDGHRLSIFGSPATAE